MCPKLNRIFLISRKTVARTCQEYGTKKINHVMLFLYSADLGAERPDLDVSSALMQCLRHVCCWLAFPTPKCESRCVFKKLGDSNTGSHHAVSKLIN